MTPYEHEVLGSWLKTFDWDWFATYTFKHPVKSFSATNALLKYFHALETRNGKKIFSAYALERCPLSSTIHIHALLANTSPLKADCKRAHSTTCCGRHFWSRGHSVVHAYDPGLAGTHYLAKGVLGTGQ